MSDCGGSPFQQGSRDWLCQTAGAAAPSGGRELREASERGGHVHIFHFSISCSSVIAS